MLTSLRIGDNIKRLRNERGFTQSYIAEKLYISQQAVAKWEKGDTFPQADKVSDLAELFGVSVSEIYDDVVNFDTKSIRVDITDFVQALLVRVDAVEYKNPDLSKLCEYVRHYANESISYDDNHYYYDVPLDKVEYDSYRSLKQHNSIDDREFWRLIHHMEYIWYETGSIYAGRALQQYYNEIMDPCELLEVDLNWDNYIELFMNNN